VGKSNPWSGEELFFAEEGVSSAPFQEPSKRRAFPKNGTLSF
jgi:hypothetical protein